MFKMYVLFFLSWYNPENIYFFLLENDEEEESDKYIDLPKFIFIFYKYLKKKNV